MPIAVQCPHCAATMRAKDELAGRTVKCPKCGGAMQLPEAPDPAKPVAKPRPADDEPDEMPRKKRPADDEDEEDDRPRSKRRSRDEDDEEDDRPRRRSRRGDKPKKSKLGLILGILGGVLVLCGGGCAGVWFGYVKPAAERVKAENDRKQAELDQLERKMNNPVPNAPVGGDVSQASAGRVTLGMNQREVDGVLGGPGKAGNKFITDEAMAAIPGIKADVTERWHKATMEGRVFVWTKGNDKVLVAYSTQPGLGGGTVSGLVGLFDGKAAELLPLPGGPR